MAEHHTIPSHKVYDNNTLYRHRRSMLHDQYQALTQDNLQDRRDRSMQDGLRSQTKLRCRAACLNDSRTLGSLLGIVVTVVIAGQKMTGHGVIVTTFTRGCPIKHIRVWVHRASVHRV